jgi:HEAT repeats
LGCRKRLFGLRQPTTSLLALAAFSAVALSAQAPRISYIELYGVRHVPEAKIRKGLGVAEGDALPSSKVDAEARLSEVPGIVSSHLEAACCSEGKTILYVGVEEKGAPHFDVRTPPDGDVELPPDIVDAYRKFLVAVAYAVRSGNAAEDLTKGHSLMSDPEARRLQERFIDLSAVYKDDLLKVLHNSSDDEHRAIAAYVIGYSRKKAPVVPELQFALKDSDDTVRGNAIRSLGALAVYAKLDPDSEIKISPTWFIEMLNSIVFTDRNNAAVALVNMTETRDASALSQLYERAFPALLEMAHWRQLSHALPAYILVGRVIGMPEQELQDAWSRGDRDTVLKKALKYKPKKSS